MNEIEHIIKNLNGYKDVVSSVNRINKKLLENNVNILDFFDRLLELENEEIFILMTLIIKKRMLYDLTYFKYYEKWLYKYVDTWGKCDAYCYRVLNPMIENHKETYNNILKWAHSEKIYVKRASMVCFIISKADFSVDYDIRKILNICDILKREKHIHIQKGLGWLLKYSYLTYPNDIEKYLRDNIDILSRTTFRYALEKMPKSLRDTMMCL